MRYTLVTTEWGSFGFVSEANRLMETFLPQRGDGTRKAVRKHWPGAEEDPHAMPAFRRQVVEYFAGKKVRFNVKVDLSSQTPFRTEVLESCRRIPYGQTASYGNLAGAVGKPGAARAVGGAMAHNPFPLVIPCHRVLTSGGGIGGFSSREGVEEKKRLLRLEDAIPKSKRRSAVGP